MTERLKGFGRPADAADGKWHRGSCEPSGAMPSISSTKASMASCCSAPPARAPHSVWPNGSRPLRRYSRPACVIEHRAWRRLSRHHRQHRADAFGAEPGTNHVLFLPPFFDRNVTPDGIEDAFAAIFDPVATIVFAPRSIISRKSPASACRSRSRRSLRQRYGVLVAGLKDSSGDFKQFQAFRAAAPDLAITVGNETDIARAVAAGGAGTICGMANVVPDLVQAMLSGTGLGSAHEGCHRCRRSAAVVPGFIEGHSRCAKWRCRLAAGAPAAAPVRRWRGLQGKTGGAGEPGDRLRLSSISRSSPRAVRNALSYRRKRPHILEPARCAALAYGSHQASRALARRVGLMTPCGYFGVGTPTRKTPVAFRYWTF